MRRPLTLAGTRVAVDASLIILGAANETDIANARSWALPFIPSKRAIAEE